MTGKKMWYLCSMEYYLSIKEWDPVFCNRMNTIGNYTQWNKPVPEREIPFISPICGNQYTEYKNVTYVNKRGILRFNYYLQPVPMLLQKSRFSLLVGFFTHPVHAKWSYAIEGVGRREGEREGGEERRMERNGGEGGDGRERKEESKVGEEKIT